MGLFNRKNKIDAKTENAFQINDVKLDINYGFGACGLGKTKREFSDFYLWLALNQLYNGVSNITFINRKQDITANEIVDFIDKNASLLVNQMLYNGYMAVSYTKTTSGYNYYIPKRDDIRKDSYGRILNYDTVVIYSPIYQLQRKSDIVMLRPQLDLINTLCNTTLNSADTMGVLPIIWGNSIPANPAFKEELEEMLSRRYGWTEDKFRYFLSKQEVHVESIDLKIKDLELANNIKESFSYICRYLGIPVDLIIGGSTFNNVEEAKVFFYSTTIRKWAEFLLKMARNLLTATGDFLPQNTINYSLNNVEGMEKTLTAMCEEKGAYIEILSRLRENGVDVKDELDKVFSDVKKLYVEV